MRFSKEMQLTHTQPDDAPPTHKPVPMRPKRSTGPDDRDGFIEMNEVARRLGVSKRFVQTLVRRKAIPVIKLGRRCVRFDFDRVLDAVKKFEIHEVR